MIEKKETVSPSTLENEETVTTKETVPAESKKKVPVKKKKGKPRGGNNWLKAENFAPGLEVGDNAKFLKVNLALFNMPEIDLRDESAVAQRLNEYFALYGQNDMKPTVAGMALALNGMSRQTLSAIAHDMPTGGGGSKTSLPPSTADLIKKAYKLMENMWESYMNSGKVNPVAGIFLGKNNYGYQDKTEYVLTPNQKQDENYSADDIRERYIASDSQKRLSDSSNDSDSDS